MEIKKGHKQNWKKPKDIFVVEDHPFDPFIPPLAKNLIIGTFPTHEKNCRFKFYYANEDNLFWAVIEAVFNHTFRYDESEDAVKERQYFLKQKKIGITDMICKCYRRNNLSGDENIFPIILRDIFSIIESHKTIERLILTSRTEVYGALGLLRTFFLQRGQQPVETKVKGDKILEGSFAWDGRNINVLVPYSPSPRLINEGRATIGQLEEMYRSCLIT